MSDPETLVRRILDGAPAHTLWRDRDLVGPWLGLLLFAVVLRDLGRRLRR